MAEPLAVEDPLRLLAFIEKLAGCGPVIVPPKYPQGPIPPPGIASRGPKKLTGLERAVPVGGAVLPVSARSVAEDRACPAFSIAIDASDVCYGVPVAGNQRAQTASRIAVFQY